MKKLAISFSMILALSIFLYHGLVNKSLKIQQIEINHQYETGQITEAERDEKLREIDYVSTFLNVAKTLGAMK